MSAQRHHFRRLSQALEELRVRLEDDDGDDEEHGDDEHERRYEELDDAHGALAEARVRDDVTDRAAHDGADTDRGGCLRRGQLSVMAHR